MHNIHIIEHQNGNSWLIVDRETGICTETNNKSKATKFPTEASAIVTLEDSEFQENYYCT